MNHLSPNQILNPSPASEEEKAVNLAADVLERSVQDYVLKFALTGLYDANWVKSMTEAVRVLRSIGSVMEQDRLY